jgi:hypothetical protein
MMREGEREGERRKRKRRREREKRVKGREVIQEGSEEKAENLIFRNSWVGAAYTEII